MGLTGGDQLERTPHCLRGQEGRHLVRARARARVGVRVGDRVGVGVRVGFRVRVRVKVRVQERRHPVEAAQLEAPRARGEGACLGLGSGLALS